ncbi:ABC transporter permease [Vallicoccus soli]|uniref:ABC transporter permease n=1 Tax=Vallicoccus soli TaxID=2339232 RepID=A0A3A3Z415_9ACTN|nr:ABC transporter permease [Vallicoccus soli]RJK95287.1 ABC transporter permease [Vallicoccus soli]
MSTGTSATDERSPQQAPPGEGPAGLRGLRDAVLGGSALLTLLAVVLALVVGAVLIVFSDQEVLDTLGYLTARPSDFLSAAWDSVSGAYSALFQGAVVDLQADTTSAALRPITETLTLAAPLIAAGLAVALAFRAGLFNIGAEGQIVLGAVCAGYVGFAWDLPVVLHLVVALAAGLLGGAVWGGIVGVLKARTGAHEVITSIMLNYVARFLLAYLLTTAAFQRPGRSDPISPFVDGAAQLPRFLGEGFRLNLGFPLALAAAAGVWWLLHRSTVGFRFRAVGANASAARTAGISVERSYTGVMLVAGGLAGLAGTTLVLGNERYLTGGISGGIGFDAITVALLGRGSALGTVLAGLLFGGLRAGGVLMQARTGTPIDIVLVVQSLIVLFIAAPPLVRSIFRVRAAGASSIGQVSKGWS